MLQFNKLTEMAIDIINRGARSAPTDLEYLEAEIRRWKGSPERLAQLVGEMYYRGQHDILTRRRTIKLQNGEEKELLLLPNHREIDNQYAKMVNQKANFLLGQPFVIESSNEQYTEYLKEVFNDSFKRRIKISGKKAYNHGIVWLHPYYNDAGDLSFQLIPGYEVLSFWKDQEHIELDFIVRLYLVEQYDGIRWTYIEKVEVYDLRGVHRYILNGNKLIPDVDAPDGPDTPHMVTQDAQGNTIGYNWQKVPFVPLRASEDEIPLISRVKSLQDGLNLIISNFVNVMDEDIRSTVFVLHNHGGANLEEFKMNLVTLGCVNIKSNRETPGKLEALEIKVNADNYKAMIDIFKRAIVENCMGYDAKDERTSGSRNTADINSMYNDVNVAANDMEAEYKAGFEQLLYFIDAHLANTGRGDFAAENVKFVFNRDLPIDEAAAIENAMKMDGLVSRYSRLNYLPFVDDVESELERIAQEEQDALDRALDSYGFGRPPAQSSGGINDGDSGSE